MLKGLAFEMERFDLNFSNYLNNYSNNSLFTSKKPLKTQSLNETGQIYHKAIFTSQFRNEECGRNHRNDLETVRSASTVQAVYLGRDRVGRYRQVPEPDEITQ